MGGRSNASFLSVVRARSVSTIFAAALLAFPLSGCQGHWWSYVPGYGGYWWQRGQPKSIAQQLTEAQATLEGALTSGGNERKEIVSPAKGIQQALSTAVEYSRAGRASTDIVAPLQQAEQQMMQLEGNLSIGSRAAYGELASELREFTDEAQSGRTTSYATFGLFTARTFRFLSSELAMPAPVIL